MVIATQRLFSVTKQVDGNVEMCRVQTSVSSENSAVKRAAQPLWLYVATLSGGGAERVFVRLANHYVAEGRVVRLVVNHGDGPLAALVDPRVEVLSLDCRRAYQAVPRLAIALWRGRPAAVISALTMSNLVAITAVQLAAIGGRRTRLMVCERNQLTSFTARMSRLKRTFMRFAVRWCYPLADAICGNAQGVVEDLALRVGRPATEIAMLPNPAPEAEQIAAARAAPPPHPWLAEADPVMRPVAVAMGRLVPQKDYPTLLQAMAAGPPQLRLIILGEGPQAAALRAEAQTLGIADRVTFAGFQMNRFDYLAHANLFLLSSLTEGFPNALIEAVAFGLPCVSTDCAGGGPRQILGATLPEALVPVADATAMAQAITVTLAAPPAADTIRNIAAHYQLDAIARRFVAEVMP
jgi:glycosyltransferase involved in cell wall biosynthesis